MSVRSPDVFYAISLVERKWTLGIVRELATGPMRNRELQRAVGISNESLRNALTMMQEEDLLERTTYREFPLRVEYSLTERGRGLLSVVGALEEWAREWA